MNKAEFIADHKSALLVQLLGITFCLVLLFLRGTERDLVLLTGGILLIALAAAMIYEYRKKAEYYHKLLTCLDSLDKKYLLAEMAEEASFLEGRILKDCLQQCGKSMNDEVAYFRRSAEEYREFIELWIHEVKTPIASAKLLIENNENEVTKSLEEDFHKVEGYLDQALYYARSSSVEKDYLIQTLDLGEIVNEAVRKYSRVLIRKKIKIKRNDLQNKVYTDNKWMQFILGQIIQNSIKYTADHPKISFYSSQEENCVILHIQDNGIGILAKDLPRVFEKGYTGTTGREFESSTGIGLYLCKKLCTKLGLDISIQSKEQKGTIISIYFPKASLYEKIR